jgi:hypothetical protein
VNIDRAKIEAMGDTDYTLSPVCPYCGYLMRDAWELSLGVGLEGDGETTCGSCERDYYVSRHVSVSYTTKEKPWP